MIHYHGIPFSGKTENHLALTGKHAMVSYAKPEQLALVAELCSSFSLDNGAYTAWKQGTRPDWDKYQTWASDWLRHPGCDFALIPDVIDGSEADNDALIGSFEIDDKLWCPVWHLHESLDRLVSLCHTWNLVALGSSGDYAEIGTRHWWSRMAEALDEITDEDGFPITRLHGLRMLDPGIFSYIPLASADSTNVARNIGIDVRWSGPYVPSTERVRALVIMDRIENHACASRWSKQHIVNQANFDLLG